MICSTALGRKDKFGRKLKVSQVYDAADVGQASETGLVDLGSDVGARGRSRQEPLWKQA